MSLLFSCASVQKPSGGEKDILPPVLIDSRPLQGETMVSPEVISLLFDEYFTLKNIQSELLVSPPLEVQPTISQKGKRLFIELHNKLKENTTYTFNFGKSIADFHEGNVLKDFSLVFSTGSIIDSLNIAGTVVPCPSNEIPENTIVALYEKDSLHSDSTIYLQKPDYFGLVDQQGHFNISHLKEGTFELIALEDVNGNYLYDGASEQIAFSNTLINSADSTESVLWLFKEEEELKLIDKKGEIPTSLTFNKLIDTAEINISEPHFVYSKLSESKLDIWPKISAEDSLITTVNIGSICDTLNFSRSQNTSLKVPTLSVENDYLTEGKSLVIYCTEPIVSIDTSKISLYADSALISYAYSLSDFELAIDIPYLGNQKFTLTFEENAISSFYNLQNDSTVLSFYTKAQNELAGLQINLEVFDAQHYYIELLEDEQVLQRKTKGEPFSFSKLLPSKYTLRLVVDGNGDGRWNSGSYLDKKAAEKVYYYPEDLKLRANWDLEIDWNPLNQLP